MTPPDYEIVMRPGARELPYKNEVSQGIAKIQTPQEKKENVQSGDSAVDPEHERWFDRSPNTA
jgi:hypothetical protein